MSYKEYLREMDDIEDEKEKIELVKEKLQTKEDKLYTWKISFIEEIEQNEVGINLSEQELEEIKEEIMDDNYSRAENLLKRYLTI